MSRFLTNGTGHSWFCRSHWCYSSIYLESICFGRVWVWLCDLVPILTFINSFLDFFKCPFTYGLTLERTSTIRIREVSDKHHLTYFISLSMQVSVSSASRWIKSKSIIPSHQLLVEWNKNKLCPFSSWNAFLLNRVFVISITTIDRRLFDARPYYKAHFDQINCCGWCLNFNCFRQSSPAIRKLGLSSH